MSVDEIRWQAWIDDLDRILESQSEAIKKLKENSGDVVAIDEIKVALHSAKGLIDAVGLKTTTQTIVEIEDNVHSLESPDIPQNLYSQLESLNIKMNKLVEHIRENKPKQEDINEVDKLLGFEAILVKFGSDYSLDISVKGEKSLRSARALGILNTLKRIGRIKTTDPKEEDLYLDTKFDTLKVVISTRENLDQITEDVNKIPHVSRVQIEKITQKETKQDINIDSLSLKIPLSQIRTLETDLTVLSGHIEALKSEISTTRGQEELTGIDNTFERLRNDLKKMRKIPFDSIVSSLSAMSSRLAQKEGKQVDLIIQGRFVTLDRAIANFLIDPITQILRNAIVHGIEKIPVRRKLKKNIIGKILLSAVNDRDKIKIKIIDDGSGIDPAALIKAAKKAGVPVNNLTTNQDKINLIFERGLSLSKVDKKIAGRGIGLYAARERIQQFGGNLSVASEKGKGTTFTIEFIDQDALSKNLIVSVGKENYAIPSSEVEQVILVNTSDLKFISDINATYMHNQEELPVVVLNNLIGNIQPVKENDNQIIVITRGSSSLIGILVDALMDERLVNIKPLNPILKNYKLFNGTLIGRDKEVILVINPAAII